MKKDKVWGIIGIILGLIFITSFIISKISDNKYKNVCINEECFKTEIADSQSERSQGLMYREHLEQDNGMLFIFSKEGIYPFWMKNTNISLDIIWINEKRKIVHIEKSAMPCKETCENIIPEEKAKYVLEINSGLSERFNFTLGDEVRIKNNG